MAKVVGTADWRDRIGTEEGIRTLALGPQAYVQVNDPRYVSDAYQYYLQGMGGGPDAATIPAAPVVQDPTTMIPQTGGQGITAASAAQNMGGVNTPFEQNLIDQGAGVQIAPGQPVVAPGEMPVTQAEMDAFNQRPVNREYGDPMDIGYGEGQVDPNLAAAVGGKDTTPLGGANLVTTSSGDVFAADDPMLQEKMDYTQQDPAWWESARDKFVQTGQDVGNTFKDLAARGIDIGKMAGSAILNFIQPGLGLITQLPISSASGAQQDLVRDQMVSEGAVLDDIGRIQQVGEYDTPENVMAGYTPGQTGLQIGDLKIGGGTIQESVVDRLGTLEKTKNEKYGGSFYNEDGTPKLNPDTGEPTTLGAREEALKENLNMVARAAGAVTLENYDPVAKKAGETTYATDYFPELGQEDTAPVTIEDIDPGFQSRFTAKDEGTFKGPGEISGVAGTTIVDPDTYMGSTVEGGLGLRETIDRTEPTIEEALGIDSTAERVMQEQIAAAEAMEAARKAEIDRQKREAEVAKAIQDEIDRRKREAAAAAANQGGGNNRDSSGTGGGWGQSATGGGWCFDPNTFVQMADGSEKKIKEIQLGDNTKGGEVTGVFQFKAADEIHDYKGVTVAGSHYVKEDGKFIMVQDSPLAVKIDKIPVVYSLDTTGRRIFIKGIEFADYNGDGIAKGFLHNAGLELNGFNKEVLRQVENRLI